MKNGDYCCVYYTVEMTYLQTNILRRAQIRIYTRIYLNLYCRTTRPTSQSQGEVSFKLDVLYT